MAAVVRDVRAYQPVRYYKLFIKILKIQIMFLKQACASQRPVHTWFLEIAFVRDIGMCVSVPKAINYIHVILNLYNQLNKFVVFRNVMKLPMHGRGCCNEACHDRSQPNKTMLVP